MGTHKQYFSLPWYLLFMSDNLLGEIGYMLHNINVFIIWHAKDKRV